MNGNGKLKQKAMSSTIGPAKELKPYRRPSPPTMVTAPKKTAKKKAKRKSKGLMNIHAQKLLGEIN